MSWGKTGGFGEAGRQGLSRAGINWTRKGGNSVCKVLEAGSLWPVFQKVPSGRQVGGQERAARVEFDLRLLGVTLRSLDLVLGPKGP